MDTNNIHDIQKDPSNFHTPNYLHNAYIPTMNQNSVTKLINNTKESTNDIQVNQNGELTLDNYDIFDNDILDNLFENTEEEVIFNYDEVDEDELEEQYEKESNKEPNQQNKIL